MLKADCVELLMPLAAETVLVVVAPRLGVEIGDGFDGIAEARFCALSLAIASVLPGTPAVSRRLMRLAVSLLICWAEESAELASPLALVSPAAMELMAMLDWELACEAGLSSGRACCRRCW
ncbi:hypothetical protein BA20089_00015 [Bifidobacterium asteroides DSM 20089]|uniref:Uncharacterized protein n=1 Tax=Bifidobacterium asteroides DSM 20089 TaxID=1437594 RepID=A0AAD0A8R4_9BIFI|nr:hypothetical protein [Bifidobacterium asteroides]ATO40749.1 hypothetical protein BA20089_00015 [Bifidobacterium asteroides DSM 20089]